MRILVIDDNPVHQASARETLQGHELTVVGTCDEAYDLLQEPRANNAAVQAELVRRGLRDVNHWGLHVADRDTSVAEQKRIEKELCPPPPFDVVLCDLFMPASKRALGPDALQFAGQEMPVGFALSLMAAQQGAKFVAVVTATNHHNHPMSAMLDGFRSQCPYMSKPNGEPPRFTINGARVGYFNAELLRFGDGQIGKNWGEILNFILDK